MPTPDKTESALARIKGQSTTSIKQVLENAKRSSNPSVAAACEAELQLRGAFVMTAQDVKRMLAAATRSHGKSLVEVIEIAFTDVQANPAELTILQWIARNPGTTFAATAKAYGRNDLSLSIGHLVYNRFGYFRPFLEGNIQSDILITRTQSDRGICYTLRAEAAEALTRLGIV